MALGCPIRKQRGREDHAQHAATLHLGDEKPEAVERMGDVLPPEAEDQHRHRRMGDARQRLQTVAGREIQLHVVHTVRGGRVYHGVV